MDYQIALSPELGLSPEAFVSGWNERPDCQEVAQARLEEGAGASYDPLLAGAALAVLGSVAINLASNALYDLIKGVLIEQGVRRETEIVQVEGPDGSRLLVVKITEH